MCINLGLIFFFWSPKVVWAYSLNFKLFHLLFLNTEIDTVQGEKEILSYYSYPIIHGNICKKNNLKTTTKYGKTTKNY